MTRDSGDWFHVVGTTYGAWLPGDERGFRTRNHREHVEGDYKNKPVGSREHLHNHARDSMNRDAVIFPPALRPALCGYLAEALDHYEIEYITLCVAATHFHILLRFPQSPPAPAGGTVCSGTVRAEIHPRSSHAPNIKHIAGRLKSWVTHRMKQEHPAAVPPAGAGGLWGKGVKVVPINDEKHFAAVRGYIKRHEKEGAAVLAR